MIPAPQEMFPLSEETVAEEQRKRVADKGGKSRMVTYALSEQMVPSDDEEEEEEEDDEEAGLSAPKSQRFL